MESTMTNSAGTDLALSYAGRNWPVFPTRAKEEYDQHTGEVLAPKTPYTSNGLKAATLNERIIREWWRRTPDAMVAVPTGAKTGVFVLDLDVKPGVGDGRDWLADMEAANDPLPATARARTMGGGTHIFFKHVDGVRNRGGLGIAVDIRGEGGYIVAPGSRAADGREYEWLDGTGPDDIADAPQWLLDLVLPPAHVASPAAPYSYRAGGNEPYIERAMQAELEELARAPAGGRGYQLNASAFSLGTMVGAGALSRADAEVGLYSAAVACGVAKKDGERETWAKIRRGLDAGQRQPRNIPERQGGHDDGNTRLVDISRMIANGLAKGRAKAASLAAQQTPSVDAADDVAPEPTEAPHEAAVAAEPPAIVATPFEWIAPADLARREFVYGTHYIRKYVSVTSSPGGLGKTSNSIVEALAMVTNRQLLHVASQRDLRVWLFNAEDPRDEMERRIMGACYHHNIGADEIRGRLFLDTGREQELVVATDDRKVGVRIVVPVVEAVVAQIKANRIDVMIIDPFVSTHRVNENDNGAIDAVAKLWGQIADETNCAIDVVHHIRKVSEREATIEDSRGAVSLISAARSARILNQMSSEQAVEALVPEEDRFSYFSINTGKSSMTKRSGRSEWRQLKSVALGNGGGIMKPQDHAGVVTHFLWPGAEEIASAVTQDQRDTIKRLLDNSNYKEGPRANDWAGKAIAEALGLDLDEPGIRKRVTSTLKAMLKDGELVRQTVHDKTRREKATFVRSAGFVEALAE